MFNDENFSPPMLDVINLIYECVQEEITITSPFLFFCRDIVILEDQPPA